MSCELSESLGIRGIRGVLSVQRRVFFWCFGAGSSSLKRGCSIFLSAKNDRVIALLSMLGSLKFI